MNSSMDCVIGIKDLKRQFGDKSVLEGVTLEVPKGGVFGLIGGNGAGKTTLIKHLIGMYKPQQGSVQVFGKDPVADPVGVLGRIGYLSEDRDLPNWMRVGELMNYTQAFVANWDPTYAEDLRKSFELYP
jgi:ABC-2 type transport system ATP-binding protein